MTLVYGLTYAGEHAWSDTRTIALLASSAVLLAAFFVIEWRSKAPLLPLRLFRSRMLSAANATMIGVGALAFGNFFVVTLYLQEVLGYSAIETGVAFIAITLSIGVFSNIGPVLATRYGVRRVLSTGMALSALGVLLYAQMPAGGHYFWDVFPALVVTGIGLGLTFVPVTIAALQGVSPADAGIASGLINTTRQIGGAVGIAAVTTIAATVTADDTGVAPAESLTHGFHAAFYFLAAIALLGALTAAAFLGRPRPAEEQLDDVVILEEAA
jgi:sugar phosphate permease